MIAKFRGRDLQGKWRYGSLVKDRDNIYIFPNKRRKSFLANFNKVNPETVGQWTGLKDKNGVDVYEGSVIDPFKHNEKYSTPMEVYWNSEIGGYSLRKTDGKPCAYVYGSWIPECEVIGTIHDQKEREE